jgi:hypothetical protein
MGHVFRRIGQSAYLILTVLAIVGMEIDVASNPFGPEFMLSRLYCLLDHQASSSGTSTASPTEASLPTPEEPGSVDGLGHPNDETVAIRTTLNPLRGQHGAVSATFSTPQLGCTAIALSKRFPNLPRLRVENQLCRFLC